MTCHYGDLSPLKQSIILLLDKFMGMHFSVKLKCAFLCLLLFVLLCSLEATWVMSALLPGEAFSGFSSPRLIVFFP